MPPVGIKKNETCITYFAWPSAPRSCYFFAVRNPSLSNYKKHLNCAVKSLALLTFPLKCRRPPAIQVARNSRGKDRALRDTGKGYATRHFCSPLRVHVPAGPLGIQKVHCIANTRPWPMSRIRFRAVLFLFSPSPRFETVSRIPR